MWVPGCSTTGCQDIVLSHLSGIGYPELSNLHNMYLHLNLNVNVMSSLVCIVGDIGDILCLFIVNNM